MSGRMHDVPMTELQQVVEAVLNAAKPQLQASEEKSVARTFDSVVSLLRAGEPVVALEILCDNLYEDNISVERRLLLNLLDAARRADVDTHRIDTLLT
jgi:hypothetical protein